MKDGGDAVNQVLEVALGGLAKQGLEFGKEVLDGIEVRRIRGQEKQGGAAGFNSLAHAGNFVAAEIIDHNHVSRLKRWAENLADIFQERLSIHGSVQEPGSFQ